MGPEQIRRLAVADLDETRLRSLVEHGEELLVERKREIPTPEKFAAVVASMANMLGGFVLLGIEDDGSLAGFETPGSLDLQSHVGNVLRNAIDPVPPFVASDRELDGKTIGIVRVFQASVPVLVTGAGTVYTRDAGGKVPISSHRDLLALARDGEAAAAEAQLRPTKLPLIGHALQSPDAVGVEQATHPKYVRAIVRAAPLSVTPQFGDWPISRAGSRSAFQAAHELAEALGAADGFALRAEPHGRGVVHRGSLLVPPPAGPTDWMSIVALDSAGVVGVAGAVESFQYIRLDDLRRRLIRPVLDTTARLLTEGEAFGDSVLDLYLCLTGRHLIDGQPSGNAPLGVLHCGSARLTVPTEGEEVAALGRMWERELARETGQARWLDDDDGGG